MELTYPIITYNPINYIDTDLKFLNEYENIFLLIKISFILAFLIVFLSKIFIPDQLDLQKISIYECGFDPYEDARNAFDIKFYLLGILFLVFDIEAVFIFPWITTIGNVVEESFFTMVYTLFDFFLELIIGLFYVWMVGALEWD